MPEISQTISHYRIVEKISERCVEEVCLADDTILDRKVALRFLPDDFTNDPGRMACFGRETRPPASLNHFNIAGIYGLEQADKDDTRVRIITVNIRARLGNRPSEGLPGGFTQGRIGYLSR